MAFIFTCGGHTFESLLSPYEHITAQCGNCGNWASKVYKRWEWFTFCFIPIIPCSLKPDHIVQCQICRAYNPVAQRPDVQQQMAQVDSGAVPMQPPQHNGPNQGWNSGNPYAGQQQQMPPVMSGGQGGPGQYQQPQGVPQYK